MAMAMPFSASGVVRHELSRSRGRGGARDAQHIGDVRSGQAPEEVPFYDFSLSLINLRHFVQGIVQGQQFGSLTHQARSYRDEMSAVLQINRLAPEQSN